MRVIFHRLADAEYLRACRTMAHRDRFIAAVDAAVVRIAADPTAGSPAYGPYRWLKAGRFRYMLYYRQLSADRVLIYAVAHASRRPWYWLRRTRRP